MWTKEQLQAINEQGKNIIVSAGAGSGKTAVLSERILRHVKEGVDLNQLLVLTFTNAAAKEMKERIRKKLIENNLHHHLDKLEQAYITTFDAYSLAICKKYFYKLNISPNIKVMSNIVVNQKKKEIVNEILEEEYELKNENFFDYLKKFTTKDDNNLVNLVFDLTNKISLKGNQDDYISNYITNFYNKEYLNELVKAFLKLLGKKYNDLLRLCEILYDMIDESNLKLQLDQILTKETFLLNEYTKLKDYLFGLKLSNLPKDSLEEAKEIKNAINESLKELKEVYLVYTSEEDIFNQVLASKAYTSFLLSLVKKTFIKLDEFKAKVNAYEFIDIAKMAIKLVSDYEDVRRDIKNNLKEILIDEYQDTSDLQEIFINKIKNNNLYMVGDIKQSIYRFRNANPYIFKEKYDKYSNNIDGIKIDLNKNFRSRQEVVNNINLTFEKIMTNEYGDANYLLDHKMNYGKKAYDDIKDDKDYNLQVLSYCDYEKEYENYSKAEIESFLIVKDIKEKLKSKIFDDGALRKAKFSDFAILIDKMTNFYTIKKILEHEGIPVSIRADISLKESSLNKVIINILLLVSLVKDNNINKEYFYYFTSLARSFLFEYDDTFIYKTVKEKAIDNEIYEKVLKVSKLLDTASNINIFNDILERFEVYNKLPIIGNVYSSLVELEFLKDTISALSDLGYTYSKLAKHLKNILDSNEDIKYPLKTSIQDSVTIMTIHKSKGLEFPICYFPLLSSKFNLSDLKGDFLYSNKYEIISPLYDDGSKKHIVHLLNKEDSLQKEISEKIRLFYVALTRVKEQIVLIYENKDYSKAYESSSNFRSFAHIIFSLKNQYLHYTKDIHLDKINLSKDYLFKTLNKKYPSKNAKLNFKETVIKNKEVTKASASKKINTILDKKSLDNINLGLEFHKCLEYLDFSKPNIDELKSSDFVKEKIKKIFHLEVFSKVKDAKVFKEYEFISTMDFKKVHGIIDLMLVYDTHIDIIDYKLSNIEDDDYKKQLKVYKDYISKKTNLETNVYVLSILNQKITKINL